MAKNQDPSSNKWPVSNHMADLILTNDMQIQHPLPPKDAAVTSTQKIYFFISGVLHSVYLNLFVNLIQS